LKFIKNGHARHHEFKERKKNSSIKNQLDDECVEDLVHQDAWLQIIGQGKRKKVMSNNLELW
jgi:hypothetical protein